MNMSSNTTETFEVQKCFDIVLEIVKDAGKVLKTNVKNSKSVECKLNRRDLVTETDTLIEGLLFSGLKKSFPLHKYIGEESVASGEKCILTDDPTWIIDPVDGTMNFVHSFPFSCISVALWVNKTAEIGIIYNPSLDQMFTAIKGHGAYLNGDLIKVSGVKDLSNALVISEFGCSIDPEIMNIIHTNISNVVKVAHGFRSMGSAALNMSYVGLGGADAYFDIGIHAWDMAAGYLVVREAGGYVCSIDGGPLNIMARKIICASSKELADQIVSLIDSFQIEHDQ